MRLIWITSLLAALTVPALGDDCRYYSGREYGTAIPTPDGFDILSGSHGYVTDKSEAVYTDHCVDEPGDVTRFVRCDNGWYGAYFYAGTTPENVSDDELLFLLNDIWYRRCD